MTKAGNSQITRTITLLITIFSLSLPAYAKYSGGTGEPNDPYQIATAEDLMLLGETPEDYDKHFILTADIDLDPNLPRRKVFDRAVIPSFEGSFVGNGHVIFNLTIAGGDYLGLLGRLGTRASVLNLGLEAVQVNGTGRYIGGLVGYNYSGDTVTSSFWDMETSGKTTSAGGTGKTTAEMQTASTFLNAGWDFVDETENGTEDIWMIIEGQTYPLLSWQKYSSGSGTATDPYQIATAEDLIALGNVPNDYDKHFILTADIDLDPNLPGRKVFDRALIANFTGVFEGNGHTISKLTIFDDSPPRPAYSRSGGLGLISNLGYGAIVSSLVLDAVDVNGFGNLAGLVGSENEGLVINCYSSGLVRSTGETSVVGGLVSINLGSIIASSSSCSVNGGLSIGGLVGTNGYGTFSGLIVGKIFNSYSTGMVAGDGIVGGLVGHNLAGSIVTSYSTGKVVGTGDFVGGLVGDFMNGSITSSFWDMEASGQVVSAAGIGKTTTAMKTIDMFLAAGWDCVTEELNGTCDYWQILPGEYPNLSWQAGGKPVMPEGLGTAEHPYLIRDANDLGTVWFEPTAHYHLETSVDLLGITWSMAVVPWFGGVFDGNGYVISNIHIEGGDFLGLFGQLRSGAKISNLSLEEVDVNGMGHYVGGLAGSNGGGGSISSSYSTGTVRGEDRVGGLVGSNGGSGSISTNYSSATVTGNTYVGGLVGFNYGNVSTNSTMGTVIGRASVGGLVGENGGSVTDTYSTGSVSGDYEVGGLVGSNCGTYGRALWRGSVINSYSAAIVTGNQSTGGLVGSNSSLAGFEPVVSIRGTVTESFWDIETSSQTESDDGTGLTTAEMQMAQTFTDAGWDFVDETANGTEDIWWIDEGNDYPRLWWEAEGN